MKRMMIAAVVLLAVVSGARADEATDAAQKRLAEKQAAREAERNAPVTRAEVDDIRTALAALRQEIADLKKQVTELRKQPASAPAAKGNGLDMDAPGAELVPPLSPAWLAKNDGPGKYLVVHYGADGRTNYQMLDAKSGRDAVRQVKNMQLRVMEERDGDGRVSYPEIQKGGRVPDGSVPTKAKH